MSLRGHLIDPSPHPKARGEQASVPYDADDDAEHDLIAALAHKTGATPPCCPCPGSGARVGDCACGCHARRGDRSSSRGAEEMAKQVREHLAAALGPDARWLGRAEIEDLIRKVRRLAMSAVWSKTPDGIEKHTAQRPMLAAAIRVNFAVSLGGASPEACGIYRQDPDKHPEAENLLPAQIEAARKRAAKESIRRIIRGVAR